MSTTTSSSGTLIYQVEIVTLAGVHLHHGQVVELWINTHDAYDKLKYSIRMFTELEDHKWMIQPPVELASRLGLPKYEAQDLPVHIRSHFEDNGENIHSANAEIFKILSEIVGKDWYPVNTQGVFRNLAKTPDIMKATLKRLGNPEPEGEDLHNGLLEMYKRLIEPVRAMGIQASKVIHSDEASK